EKTPPLHDSSQILMMMAGALCNDAILQRADSPALTDVIGDATEAALVLAAARFGLLKPQLDAAFPRIHEVPFDSARKRMTTLHRIDSHQLKAVEEQYPSIVFVLAAAGVRSAASQHVAFTKGAVDGLIERCTHVLAQGHREPLNPNWHDRIEK